MHVPNVIVHTRVVTSSAPYLRSMETRNRSCATCKTQAGSYLTAQHPATDRYVQLYLHHEMRNSTNP